MRWLRTPLLHFLAGGAVLFWWVHGSSPPTAPVVVTARDVSRLRLDYTPETGVRPASADGSARHGRPDAVARRGAARPPAPPGGQSGGGRPPGRLVLRSAARDR